MRCRRLLIISLSAMLLSSCAYRGQHKYFHKKKYHVRSSAKPGRPNVAQFWWHRNTVIQRQKPKYY